MAEPEEPKTQTPTPDTFEVVEAEPEAGWQWVTDEPWGYTHWSPDALDAADESRDTLRYHDNRPTASDWGWRDHHRSESSWSTIGFVVEFPAPFIMPPCYDPDGDKLCGTPAGGCLFDGMDMNADGICDNGIDDDRDGAADCDDNDCVDDASCAGPGEPTFVRGDSNSDGSVNLTDGVIPLLFLFSGGAAPACLDATDTNDTGSVEITDAIIIFSWLFSGGAAPAALSREATVQTAMFSCAAYAGDATTQEFWDPCSRVGIVMEPTYPPSPSHWGLRLRPSERAVR